MNSSLPSDSNRGPRILSPDAIALLRRTRQGMLVRMLSGPAAGGGVRGAGASRRQFLKGALLGAAAWSLPWAARGAAVVQQLSGTNFVANAEFEFVDTSTCALGDITHVSVLTGVSMVKNGETNPAPLTAVAIARLNFCTFYSQFAIGNVVNPTQIIDSKLRTASVDVDIPVQDEGTNTVVLAHVNIQWTALSNAAAATFNDVFTAPGLTVGYHSTGKFIPAIAVGSVTIGTHNFTPQPSIEAIIGKAKTHLITVQH